MKMDAGKTYQLSIGVSIIMIIMYLAALLFKLVTHRGVYQHKSDEVAHEEEPEWSKKLLILAIATIAVAYVSRRSCIHLRVAKSFGWSDCL